MTIAARLESTTSAPPHPKAGCRRLFDNAPGVASAERARAEGDYVPAEKVIARLWVAKDRL